MTGAAMAMLGLWAALPLQAQGGRTHTQILLSTLNTVTLESSDSVTYAKLDGYDVYLIGGSLRQGPECVIFDSGSETRGNLEQVARRFAAAYKLDGSKVVRSKNGRSALLLRGGDRQRWSRRWQQAAEALTQGGSVAPVVEWLQVACGAPHRVDRGRVVWREKAQVGNSQRDMEISVSLQKDAPCYVDVRIKGVNQSQVAHVIDEQLRMNFVELTNNKASFLRRSLGAKPLAVMTAGGSEHGICLLKQDRDVGAYRVGEYETLRKLRNEHEEQAWQLPSDVTQSRWADEMNIELPVETTPTPSTSGGSLMGSLQVPTSASSSTTTTSTRTPSQSSSNAVNPVWHQEASGDDEEDAGDADDDEDDEESGSASGKSAPARAREAFIQRLRAL